MATSGLNYLISVQIDQLAELTKLHNTIVGIQQLSQKGADFNVRVNASSLTALTQEISNSVSKGFSSAAARVQGPQVTIDTTQLESSISKLAEAIGSMRGGNGESRSAAVAKFEAATTRFAEAVSRMPAGGGGGGGVVNPPAQTGGSAAQRTNQMLRNVDEAIKVFDDLMAERISRTDAAVAKLEPYFRRIVKPEALKADTEEQRAAMQRQDLVEFRERLAARVARYGSGGSAPGIAIDASVLKQAFESGSLRLADAMRKGIEDATAGLSAAITEAVVKGFNARPPVNNQYAIPNDREGYGTVTPGEAEKIVRTLGPYMSTQQLQQAQDALSNDPSGQSAGALRVGSRYLSGLSTRDQGLFAQAASGGVMALPPEYRKMLSERVRSSAEVLQIEERIARLISRRGEAAEARDKATLPSEQERFGKAYDAINAQIDEARLEKDQAIIAQMNAQIQSAVAQYRALLTGLRGSGQITPDEYTRKIGALKYADERRTSMIGDPNSRNIEREMLLLPSELAQYIRDTLKRYVEQLRRMADGGPGIDQSLLDEIKSNDLLSQMVGGKYGRPPEDARQARAAYQRVNQVYKEFGQAKTAYEVIKGRAKVGLPLFNPNLDIETAPYLAGDNDPGSLPREVRERILKGFMIQGGGFASQTEERRRYAEAELKKLQEQAAAETLSEAGQRRMLEYQREMEFGGRYYFKQSAFAQGGWRYDEATGTTVRVPGMIDNNVLMSSAEAARVRAGGPRSAVVGGSLAPVQESLSAEAKAATELYRAMGYVESALTRVTRAIGDLSKVSFDPVVKQFQELSAVLAPYAASLERVAKLVDVQYGVKRAADAKLKQEAIEQAKSAGLADRLALAQSLGISVGMPEFSVPGASMQSAGAIPLASQDPETLRALVMRGAKQIAGLQSKSQDLLALEAAQLAAGMSSTGTARRIGAAGTQYNATMATFATNAAALAQRDPRFFGVQSQNVIGAAQGFLGAQGRTIQLGDELRVLTSAMEQFKQIQAELKRLEGNKSPAADLRRQSLTGVREKLLEARDASLDRLLKAGILAPGESSANTAKVVSTLRDKQRELNAEVAKYSDLLLKASESSVKAEMAGGGFLDRVVNKFQNLSAYLFAGGLLYTLSSQLRQASAAAIGLEADMARIQGVLSSRSAGQAGIIAQGVMSGAMDYGTDMRTAVQSAKIFAQTGASPSQTVELTRAALAAQVGAGLEAGQATELLIAVENITNRQVKAFDILDRISRVESQYAVSAQDLSNAIQRAGSLATQLQPQALGAVDALDLIIGSATTIIERTRVTGEQAATSLRFIISRLAAPEVSRSLQERFGIKLAGDTPDTLRPLQDILKDIADRYRELRGSGQTVQAQQLLTTFAGARQSNVAAALLEGFDDALRVASESALAYGDTQERVKLQLETMQSKFAQFNTAFVGFASSLFNDTGLGWGLKKLLGAGTSVLETSQSAGGAIGTGALLLGGGYAARAGASALLNVASGTAGASAIAAGGGATLLGGLATGGVVLGGFLAVVGALEMVAKTLQKRAEREAVRTSERFDRELFRQSPFYQAFQEQSIEFGMSPEDMSARFLTALTNADTAVQKEIAAGKLSPDQAFNRTTQLLVAELDKTVTGFASIGDQSQRTSTALQLLRESARYTAAVPQTYTNEFIKDLEDLTSEFDKNAPKLGEAVRGLVKTGLGTWSAIKTFEFDRINEQFKYRGRQFLNVPSLTASGTGLSFAQLAARNPGKEIQTLDQYARDFLLVTSEERTRLRAAETELRQKGREVNPLSVQSVLNEDRTLTPEARTDLGLSYFRLGNQRDLAAQIARSLNVALGNDDSQRLEQMRRDLGGSTEPGEVFAKAFRDAIELAREQMIEAARAANMSAAGIDKLNERLNRLNDSSSRVAKDANLTVTSISVRDRMFEPIAAFGSRMAEIGTRQRMSAQFGLDYDSVAAESQAAQEFLVGLDQVPIRLLQDRIREAARLVSAGTGTLVRTVAVADEGGATGGTGPVRFDDTEMLNGLLLGRKQDIDKVDQLRKMYVSATTEGLGPFIDRAMGSSNEQLRNVAFNLKDALDALGAFGSVETKEDLQELARLEGNLEKQRKEAADIVGKLIDKEVTRTLSLREISRGATITTSNLQLAGNREQALLQARLGMQQADPRLSQDALNTQLEMLTVTRNVRGAMAAATRDATVNQLMLQPDTEKRKQDLLDAQATYEREIAAANSERAIGQFNQVSQLNAQLQRRQQEDAMRLVQDLTNPLSELLMSSKNFSRAGYERAFEGVAQAAQRRLVEMFMKNTFSETGMLGATLRDAFNTGALSTQTAIEAGFAAGVAQLQAVLTGQIPGALYNGEGAITFGENGGANLGPVAGPVVNKMTMKQRLGNFATAALPLVGSLAGGAINTGIDNSSAGEGAAIGAMIGNMIVPGLGGLAGGLLGGLFGSRIGKGDDGSDRQISALERIEANTRQQIDAIENQTRMLTLDSRFMNVPTGFTVPGFRPFGTGGGDVNLTVNISGNKGDPQETANLVSDAIRKELRGLGTSYNVLNN